MRDKIPNHLQIDYWKGRAVTKSQWHPTPAPVTLGKEEAFACGLYLTSKDGSRRKAKAFIDIHGGYIPSIKGRKPDRHQFYFRGARIASRKEA